MNKNRMHERPPDDAKYAWQLDACRLTSIGILIFSKISNAFSRALSKPSLRMRWCNPSAKKISACFSNSPISKTVDVVPSPVISSWAVDARAISDAVGCWICISCRSTLPSLVILMSPAPETNLNETKRHKTLAQKRNTFQSEGVNSLKFWGYVGHICYKSNRFFTRKHNFHENGWLFFHRRHFNNHFQSKFQQINRFLMKSVEKNMREQTANMNHQVMFYTYIFIVPFGPRLVFITSCNPFDAEMLMANAWAARANSAFGFNKLIEAIFFELFQWF